MSYVVYNKFTTKYLTRHPGVKTKKETFASYAAAQSAITREHNNGRIDKIDFLIAEYIVFKSSIEKTETVNNLMTGKPVVQSVNTPWTCSVASETYWSS